MKISACKHTTCRFFAIITLFPSRFALVFLKYFKHFQMILVVNMYFVFYTAGPGSKEATAAAGNDRRAPAQTGQGPPACI